MKIKDNPKEGIKIVNRGPGKRLCTGPHFEEVMAGFTDPHEKFAAHFQMMLQDMVDDYIEKEHAIASILIMEQIPKAYAAGIVALLFRSSLPESAYSAAMSRLAMDMVDAMSHILAELRERGGPESLKKQASEEEKHKEPDHDSNGKAN